MEKKEMTIVKTKTQMRVGLPQKFCKALEIEKGDKIEFIYDADKNILLAELKK